MLVCQRLLACSSLVGVTTSIDIFGWSVPWHHHDIHQTNRLQAHMRTEISSGLHAEEGWLGFLAAGVKNNVARMYLEGKGASPKTLLFSVKHCVFFLCINISLHIILLFVHKIWNMIWMIWNLNHLAPKTNFWTFAVASMSSCPPQTGAFIFF